VVAPAASLFTERDEVVVVTPAAFTERDGVVLLSAWLDCVASAAMMIRGLVVQETLMSLLKKNSRANSWI
jgi:hypothetical protein